MTQILRPVELYTITEKENDQRLDNFLVCRLKSVPKGRIYKMIRKGEVRINKSRVKPNSRVYLGDVVRIPPVSVEHVAQKAAPGKKVVELIESSILFEDECIIVLNKPTGIAVHGGSGLNFGVIEALRHGRGEKKFLELVHRLDRDTSGCLLIAKKRSALKVLHEALRNNLVEKRYHAMVSGKWPKHLKIVDAPLKKNELKSGERIVRVTSDGKSCRTEYRIIKAGQRYTLVQAKPITGRTHQIRVHCQYSGHSIVGDDKYWNGDKTEFRTLNGPLRLMLHAHQLVFPHPDGENRKVDVTAPYDESYQAILDFAMGGAIK